VKVSGDGAKMTRNSNLVVFSFALLDQGGTVMSSTGIVMLIITMFNIHT